MYTIQNLETVVGVVAENMSEKRTERNTETVPFFRRKHFD